MADFMYKIFNEDCIKTLERFKLCGNKFNIVMTSPPYNTAGKSSTSESSRNNYDSRYDIHMDNMSNGDYCNWCCRIFNLFDSTLEKNGVVLWNVSYGNDVKNKDSIGLMWVAIAEIIKNTPFTVADRIIWKKKSALPNNSSKNKLTRIVEDIFVFCRKDEFTTFDCNKEISGVGKNGQTFYKNYFNFIEAKNNDGACKLNKATYSSELCEQLLSLYGKEGDLVYDPFNGTGTTGVACKRLGMWYIGSEISSEQVQYSIDRINNSK